jgi:acyl carrier protein
MAGIHYEKVLAQTVEIISSFSNQAVTEDTNLVKDINLDSIGIAELVAEIEDRFNVIIPMERLPEMRTVRDIAVSLVPLVNQERDLGSV